MEILLLVIVVGVIGFGYIMMAALFGIGRAQKKAVERKDEIFEEIFAGAPQTITWQATQVGLPREIVIDEATRRGYHVQAMSEGQYGFSTATPSSSRRRRRSAGTRSTPTIPCFTGLGGPPTASARPRRWTRRWQRETRRCPRGRQDQAPATRRPPLHQDLVDRLLTQGNRRTSHSSGMLDLWVGEPTHHWRDLCSRQHIRLAMVPLPRSTGRCGLRATGRRVPDPHGPVPQPGGAQVRPRTRARPRRTRRRVGSSRRTHVLGAGGRARGTLEGRRISTPAGAARGTARVLR